MLLLPLGYPVVVRVGVWEKEALEVSHLVGKSGDGWVTLRKLRRKVLLIQIN
jgi:hypothetical protein